MTQGGADTIGRVKISFPVTFSLICSAAVIVVSVLFWIETHSIAQTLIFVAAASAAGGQITVSFYTARLLSETLRQTSRAEAREQKADAREAAREERETARTRQELRQGAMEFGRRWNDPGMFHIRDTLREINGHTGGQDELMALADKKPTNVIHAMNFFEEIATARRFKLADEEVLRESFDYLIISLWDRLYPWTQKHRQDRGNKEIWKEVERVVHDWKA